MSSSPLYPWWEATKLKYLAVIEKGGNSFGAYVPDLPGCAVMGETREEGLQLIREAIELHISSMREQGDPLPEPVSTIEYVQI
jgi:predicted RNase H-like HicB family nuclease